MTQANGFCPPMPRHCRLHPLRTLPDHRGDLTEMFREEWFQSPPPRLWHVVHGRANALMGVRVHALDWLYLCLLNGSLFASLTDLRGASNGGVSTAELALSDSSRQVLIVAPGVAHGFYFTQPVTYLRGRVLEADPAEHLLCAWNSPDLDVAWPCAAPGLVRAEQDGIGFAEFKSQFAALSAEGGGA